MRTEAQSRICSSLHTPPCLGQPGSPLCNTVRKEEGREVKILPAVIGKPDRAGFRDGGMETKRMWREVGRNGTHVKLRLTPWPGHSSVFSARCGCWAQGWETRLRGEAAREMHPSPRLRGCNFREPVIKQISAAAWQPSQTLVARK